MARTLGSRLREHETCTKRPHNISHSRTFERFSPQGPYAKVEDQGGQPQDVRGLPQTLRPGSGNLSNHLEAKGSHYQQCRSTQIPPEDGIEMLRCSLKM